MLFIDRFDFSKYSIIYDFNKRWLHYMNKKEVLEIKKLFAPDIGVLTRICGCYVDAEKNIKFKMKEAFNSIKEEDAFKYYDIFRQSLSGTIGKNLLNLDFPLSSEEVGGTQEFLLRLRDSELNDDSLLDEFYQKVIDNYNYGENYYIVLIHGIYDVPGKSTDGSEMFDASENVYNYILCSICPVNLSKAGLSYDVNTNSISDRIRDWVVDAPAKGFLFPVFNDRTNDIHSVLYYTKNSEDLQEGFIDNLFGASKIPLSAKTQNESFNNIIVGTLGDECEYEVIKNIHETLTDMIVESKEKEEPLVLTKSTVKHILEESGAKEEQMENFDSAYIATVGSENTNLLASNITSVKNFTIETPEISIKVRPECADLIETRIIDGKKCFVIPVSEGVEVNGLTVRA